MFEKIKLKNLVDLRAGIGFPNKYQGNKNSNIPFYKVGDISREFQKCNFYINNADNYITAEILAELKGKLFDEGTIIFAKVGEALKLNRRIILTQKAMIDNNIFGIKSNNPCLNNKYLFYFLLQYDLGNICKTGAVPSVNQSDIYSISIPLPPTLEEQQEIVDVLDAASEIIRLRTACIESAQSLIPALFQEMFGDPINNNKNWPIVKIDTVTNVISGGTPSTKIPEYWDGDIVWLTPKDLSGYNSVYISKGERNITDLGYKKSSAQIMPKGSVLFTSRAPIGYVAIADTDLCTNQGFKSFVPSMDIKSEYLYQLLKMMKPKILNMASGAVFKEISGSKIKELKIPLPNIELQNQFATKVQEIESYIKTQQAELENAKTMFQSLLHHSFTGELTRRAYGE